ncbi:MAG: SMC-Scp complex subunit ScpB [Spirochaetota bacterium]|nr:SMC-Scp complex subunit ScpB [Spirochaetota bacterium]
MEALLFISSDPLTVPFFVRNIGLDSKSIKEILKSLVEEYEERDGGIKLAEISGGFQFVTDRKYADEIREVMGLKKKMSLSKGMLETLAIIAYKQPIVLADIDELRGVSSRIMIAKLIEKRLIKPAGRKNLPGRPLIYSTTDDFLRLLGLNDLTDLPKLSEIKELSLEFEDEG